MSFIRRLSALALALAILAGLPYVLVWHLPWPALDLSWTTALVHVRSLSAPPGVAMAALIVALWAVWGLYAAGIAAELVARGRGGRLPFRPLGPLQVVAATALGATVASPASALADTVQVEQVQPGELNLDPSAEPRESPRPAPAADETAPPADLDSGPAEPGSTVERSRTVAGFALNSDRLTDPMREDLTKVADMIRDFGGSDHTVHVTGHADQTGPEEFNQQLSEQRARAAADFLREKLGEDAPRIETEGLGSSDPRDGDLAAQRRIEVDYTVVSGEQPNAAPTTPQAQPTPDAAEDAPQQDAPANANADAGGGTGGGAETGGGAGDTAAAGDSAGGGAGEGTGDNAAGTADSAAGEPAGEGAEEGAPVVAPPILPTSADRAVPEFSVDVANPAVAGAIAVAGIVGGYAMGRGKGVPGLRLSLPRLARNRKPAPPRALPPAPPRPEVADDIDERVTVELDHVPGIGLTGAGSYPAARRLVVNALGDPEQRPARILLTDELAERFLGREARDALRADPCEPVRIVPTMEDALAELQRELHERAADPLTSAEGDPLVLITEPDARHEMALSGLLLHGQRRGITAVTLGRWPLGGSCTVAADGLITETSPPLNPLFHASWPGSTQADVAAAVRAHAGAGDAGSAWTDAAAAPVGEVDWDALPEWATAESAAPAADRADTEQREQEAEPATASAAAGAGAEESVRPMPRKAGRRGRARFRRLAAESPGDRSERLTDADGFSAALLPDAGGAEDNEAGAGATPSAPGTAVEEPTRDSRSQRADGAGAPQPTGSAAPPVPGERPAPPGPAAASAPAEASAPAASAERSTPAAPAEASAPAQSPEPPDAAVPAAPAVPAPPIDLPSAVPGVGRYAPVGPVSPLRRGGSAARSAADPEAAPADTSAGAAAPPEAAEDPARTDRKRRGRPRRPGADAAGDTTAEVTADTAPAPAPADAEAEKPPAPAGTAVPPRRRGRFARLGDRADRTRGAVDTAQQPPAADEAAPDEGADAPATSGADSGAAPRRRDLTPRAARVRRMREAQADAEREEAPPTGDAADRDPQGAVDPTGADGDADHDGGSPRLPRKPKKAGRGRAWRPRETT
ncbi:OmpA family protein [Streptomonospora sp. S1-112]|uniref:OmpA family protein n=1 Tax=Streptomonospora mangrovi TaxID=2883123 RepID=A0A9X3NMP5_9ACTN|nr:OmpA family protein [Streptomonospora mangrovi]MDA0566138.1 OmpA family protein [Streptomonospora mangrovi]